MKNLPISSSLPFPADAATQTFAFIGRKGSGKTYGAGRFVELLIETKNQVVILDTVGNWYGLRLAANGKDPGIDIPILGGLRGDIPLEATGGSLIADVVVDTGRSMIIDVSQFSQGDRRQFATAFGERLWKRKKAQRVPTPVHLIMEECQLIVPQKVGPEQARMVGIYEEIIRLGRNYGIGVSMITQRPQSVNKEVLNQTECLMAFQISGSHERKALREWIVHNGMDANLVNELPAFDPGECYCWSPQWLGVLQKIKISEKWTFDSTRTPKAGQVRRRGEFKALDLSALQEKMKETIEKAKADDPRELKKKIAELEKKLKGGTLNVNGLGAKPVIKEKIKEVPVLKDGQLGRLERIVKVISDSFVAFKEFELTLKELKAVSRPGWPANLPFEPKPDTRILTAKQTRRDAIAVTENIDGLGKGEKMILAALIQFPNGLERKQLTVLCGYKQSARDTYISRLVQRDLAIIQPGKVFATEQGIAALPNFEPLPTGKALVDYWLQRLPLGEKKILEFIIEYYPEPVHRGFISEHVEYKQSARDTYLSRLASKELVVIQGQGQVKASDNLF